MADWIVLALFPITVLSAALGVGLAFMGGTKKVRLIGVILLGIALLSYCTLDYQTDPLLHGHSSLGGRFFF